MFCHVIWISAFYIHKSCIVDGVSQAFKNLNTVYLLIHLCLFAFTFWYYCEKKIFLLKRLKFKEKIISCSFASWAYALVSKAVFSIDLIKEQCLAFRKFGNFQLKFSEKPESSVQIFCTWPMFIMRLCVLFRDGRNHIIPSGSDSCTLQLRFVVQLEVFNKFQIFSLGYI